MRASTNPLDRPQVVNLIDAAPWLVEGVDDLELAEARRALEVPSVSWSPGPAEWSKPAPSVGYLVLRGAMARTLRVEAGPARGLELIGTRDLIRPGQFAVEAISVAAAVRWQVLADVELAVLDDRFVAAISRWPILAINLLNVVSERVWTFANLLTARQMRRLDARILLTLWFVADRWGQITTEGAVVNLPGLTHEMLAQMVSARRPSVTTSLGSLRRLGLLRPERGGRWVLRSNPEQALGLLASQPEGEERAERTLQG